MKQLKCRLSTVVFLFIVTLEIISLSCNKADPATRPPLRSNPPVIDSISPKTGPVGTVVTVYGKNLGDNTSEIFVNGKKATITSASATKFVITVPDSAGTGPVKISTKDGQVSGPPIFNYIFTEGWIVSTIAGSSVADSTNGAGNVARFNDPEGIVLDASGNLYVADGGNNKIRKITPSGVVSTFAGSAQGFGEGIGGLAKFYDPLGIGIDAQNNLYVSDSRNNKIRKITAGALTTTIAGIGLPAGSTDGAGTVASFAYPIGIIINQQNNIYVADASSNKIRVINAATTTVSTLAGGNTAGFVNNTGVLARFSFPAGVVQDPQGNLYVTDFSNQVIRKVTTPSGIVTTLAGNGGLASKDAIGLQAGFYGPYGLAFDAAFTNLYVTDRLSGLIRKISMSDLKVTTLAGNPANKVFADGDGLTKATFNLPSGIVVDAQGNLYVADAGNNRIRKLTFVKH